MRKIQVMLFAVTAVFTFSVVVMSSALAAPAQWYLNGVLIPTGKANKALVDAKDVGGVLLSDMKGGLFGEEVTIKCSGTGHGYVWNEGGIGMAESTEITELECTTTKGTCAPKPELTAINLPWLGELTSTTSALAIVSEGKEPGYTIKCSFGVNDQCTLDSSASLSIESKATDIDVIATQEEAEAHPGSCVRGGTKQALKIGRVLVLDPGGNLSVK